MEEIMDFCRRRGLTVIAIGQHPLDNDAEPGWETGAVLAHNQEKSEFIAWSWSGGAGADFSTFWGRYIDSSQNYLQARAEGWKEFTRKMGIN